VGPMRWRATIQRRQADRGLTKLSTTMKYAIFSRSFVCALAFAGRFAVAADPNVPATSAAVEAADRQFLSNLERADDAQRAAEAAEPKRTQPAPAAEAADAHGSANTHPSASAPVRTRELTSKPVTPVKKPVTAQQQPVAVAQAKPEEVQKKQQEPVEVRRATPVETTTTTVTTTARRDRDRDDDRDDDGFFHRLFHGEKIFR